jgi:hypothetical protein
MRRSVLLLSAALSGALAAGCGDRAEFCRTGYDMIRPGADDRYDVLAMIGRPEFDACEEWYYEDAADRCAARIFFDGRGRVRGKQWLNAETGEWEGENPDLPRPALRGETRQTSTVVRTADPY